MPSARQHALDVIQEHLVDEDGMLEVPIELYRLADPLGVEVVEGVLEEGTDGLIISEPPSTPRIFLNRSIGTNRKRFTLAHELGHFVKHDAAGDHKFGYVDHRNDVAGRGTDPDEIWANQFAANLLMPPPIVRKFYGEGYGVSRMAREFKVSEAAMGFHLTNLGLM